MGFINCFYEFNEVVSFWLIMLAYVFDFLIIFSNGDLDDAAFEKLKQLKDLLKMLLPIVEYDVGFLLGCPPNECLARIENRGRSGENYYTLADLEKWTDEWSKEISTPNSMLKAN